MYAAASRQRGDFLRATATALRVLGPDTAWMALTPERIAGVWRHLARLHAATGQSGPRQAEVVVAALHAVAQWLRDHQYIDAGACRPRKWWRRLLAADWREITGAGARPQQPRHTPEEVRAVFAYLQYANPRLRLAIELGPELRLGQVLRASRRDLDLRTSADCPHGCIEIRGRGRKDGEVVFLTPEQRTAIDAALGGYLLGYEAAFAAGRVADYPLFPGGRFVRGAARVRPHPPVLSRRTALELFHALERAAGVEPVPGRGWYGLRRAGITITPHGTTGDHMLERVGGHQTPRYGA